MTRHNKGRAARIVEIDETIKFLTSVIAANLRRAADEEFTVWNPKTVSFGKATTGDLATYIEDLKDWKKRIKEGNDHADC